MNTPLSTTIISPKQNALTLYAAITLIIPIITSIALTSTRYEIRTDSLLQKAVNIEQGTHARVEEQETERVLEKILPFHPATAERSR